MEVSESQQAAQTCIAKWADMMKKLGKRGGLGALKGMMGGKGAPSQAELAAAQEQITSGAMGSGMPKGMSLARFGRRLGFAAWSFGVW